VKAQQEQLPHNRRSNKQKQRPHTSALAHAPLNQNAATKLTNKCESPTRNAESQTKKLRNQARRRTKKLLAAQAQTRNKNFPCRDAAQTKKLRKPNRKIRQQNFNKQLRKPNAEQKS
jgi:hypothetical protein